MWKKGKHFLVLYRWTYQKSLQCARGRWEEGGIMGLNLLPNFQIGGGLKGFLLNGGCWEKRGGVNFFKELQFLHEKQTKIWNI